MVSTPKTSNTPPNELNSKVNIMSPYQDFSQCIDPASIENSQEKSGILDTFFLYDYFMGNDLFPEAPSYISPVLTSSMTTPSLVVDGVSTPQDLSDSPIYNPPFAPSPSLEPPTDFFPELMPVTTAASGSLMQQIPIAPSVTIPVDDLTPLTTIHGNSSPSVNIPWTTEATSSSTFDDLIQDVSSTSPYLSISSDDSPKNSFMSISSAESPKSSLMPTSSVETPKSPAVVSSSSTTATPTSNKLGTRHRKRSIGEIAKDPQHMADELAMKRAKNTDAARRSRLRKVMKMETLEKQVIELKKENTDLQTRIAVLESEKKGLEDKNAEKESRVKMLEQQLSEAHERLIKKS